MRTLLPLLSQERCRIFCWGQIHLKMSLSLNVFGSLDLKMKYWFTWLPSRWSWVLLLAWVWEGVDLALTWQGLSGFNALTGSLHHDSPTKPKAGEAPGPGMCWGEGENGCCFENPGHCSFKAKVSGRITAGEVKPWGWMPWGTGLWGRICNALGGTSSAHIFPDGQLVSNMVGRGSGKEVKEETCNAMNKIDVNTFHSQL